MVPIFPNNNLSVSSVIVGACMQGQLHKEGLCVYWGEAGCCDAFDTFMLFYFRLHKLVVTNAGGRHLVMLRVQGEKGEQSKAYLLVSIREGQVQNE